MKDRLVRDVMCRGVVTCDANSTLREAVEVFADHSVHAMIVLDEFAEACGVITNTDVMKKFGQDVDTITVEQVMTPHVLAVKATAPLADAVALMQAQHVHQLVIYKGEPNQRRPIGIISVGDVVREIAKRPRTIERRYTYASSGNTDRKVEG
ncbi:MAG: CBS domain-containing protein [Chloroflexi bacterium]|nr:CBS domain-containing protein [Chloroflexota bacterium]